MKRYLILFLANFLVLSIYSQEKAELYFVNKKNKIEKNYWSKVDFEKKADKISVDGKIMDFGNFDLTLTLSNNNELIGSVYLSIFYDSNTNCAFLLILKPYFFRNQASYYIQGYEYSVLDKKLSLLFNHEKLALFSMDRFDDEDFYIKTYFSLKDEKLFYIFATSGNEKFLYSLDKFR